MQIDTKKQDKNQESKLKKLKNLGSVSKAARLRQKSLIFEHRSAAYVGYM